MERNPTPRAGPALRLQIIADASSCDHYPFNDTRRRRFSRIVSLEHFKACAAVVQHAVNLWSRNAARQKVPTLDLMEALYVEGIKQEYVAYDFRMTQQAISLHIGRALEFFDEKYGHLCLCDDLSLLSVCYNASIGWTKRFENVSRAQDLILVPKVPFRARSRRAIRSRR